jgi:hypothetical protein
MLRTMANRYLGQAYHAQGDYRRAIECFRQTMTSFDGAQRRERVGRIFLPAVASRTWIAMCDAEVARLDRLRTAKGLAQLCATLGRHFSFELLGVVS